MIWYIHPAAGGPGHGRYWRAYHFARHWRADGAECLVIGPGYHHHYASPEVRTGAREVGGQPYYFVRTSAYGEGRIGRARAMFEFAIALDLDRGLKRLGDANPPKLIIYSSPYPFGVYAAARLARRYGARFVFEVRDIWPDSVTELTGASRLHPFVMAAAHAERFAYQRADQVVSVLPHALPHMIGRGLAPEKYVHVPNGIDPADARMAGTAPETPCLSRIRELKAQDKFILVYAGGLGQVNNLEPLLDAMRLLQDRGVNNVHTLLIGRGDYRDTLKARVQARQLTALEFIDQVDKTEIVHILAAVDAGYISLMPSPLFRFGVSPNKIFDYMLAKLPIVYAVEAGNDPVKDAGAGLTVPPSDPARIADAVAQLASKSQGERAAIGAAGYDYVCAHHDHAVLSRKMLALMPG